MYKPRAQAVYSTLLEAGFVPGEKIARKDLLALLVTTCEVSSEGAKTTIETGVALGLWLPLGLRGSDLRILALEPLGVGEGERTIEA